MAVFKCKVCGGDLLVDAGNSIAGCEYCGTQQTVPTTQEERLQNLFNRATSLRRKCDFDRAQDLFAQIVGEDNSDAEAYWGLVLCRYGIEYVEDVATRRHVPTCHRTEITSVLADVDYLAAIENADANQKSIYEREAREIDALQKDILKIAGEEKPFDVFICYKETDEVTKQRTQDSVMANDMYHQLTAAGYKVFFSAITLEGKLGQAYEPYIFAALNSARVMLVVGSKPEYFKATWVKNEWSRYLKRLSKDRSLLLIPCYRDMDPYDLPDEFAHLQAQDMSKIGFMQDILHGIKKVLGKKEEKVAPAEVVTSTAAPSIKPMLRRVSLFLEDGDFERAEELCDKILDVDPECAEAYLRLSMSYFRVSTEDELIQIENFDKESNYIKALRFASGEIKARLEGHVAAVAERKRLENERCAAIYAQAEEDCRNGNLDAAKEGFLSISDYQDAVEKARLVACEQNYRLAFTEYKQGNYAQAAKLLGDIRGYRDAGKRYNMCHDKAVALRTIQAAFVPSGGQKNHFFAYSNQVLKKFAEDLDHMPEYADSARMAQEIRNYLGRQKKIPLVALAISAATILAVIIGVVAIVAGTL